MRGFWPLVLAIVVLTGCGSPNRNRLIPLAAQGALSPPMLLAYAPGSGLVALATETDDDGGRQLALWRADSAGTAWTRWAGLGRAAATGRVALAVTADHALVAGVADTGEAASEDRRIWIDRLALSASIPAEGAIEETEITCAGPVLALAMDAPLSPEAVVALTAGESGARAPDAGPAADSGAPPVSGEVGTTSGAAGTATDSLLRGLPGFPSARAPRDSLPWVHLVYLVRTPDPETKRIAYRRSADGGATWSAAETLAEGDVARPALFARSRFRRTVDVCYPRGVFMQYRGSGSAGKTWQPEREIRLRAGKGSNTGIARHERELLTICENDLHQVAGATSENSGQNWERAIAVARSCDHVRVPSIDHGGGLFWVGFSQGDTAVVVRSTVNTLYPRQWDPAIIAAHACCLDAPAIAALPDSMVGVLFCTCEGEALFTRINRPPPPED